MADDQQHEQDQQPVRDLWNALRPPLWRFITSHYFTVSVFLSSIVLSGSAVNSGDVSLGFLAGGLLVISMAIYYLNREHSD